MISPVILSGGSGTRLWPLSRKDYPKQYLNLLNNASLFQNTITRLPEEANSPLIICNEEHRFIVAEQLRHINKSYEGIILEPIGKNTAPAVALASIYFNIKSEDPILLVLSSDHLIENNLNFHKALKIAENLAEKGKLVTFGISPTAPETGYGYIEANKTKKNLFYSIKSFKEKPNSDIAKKYLQQDNFYWNSGIFMFRASVFLDELQKYSPEILTACQKSFKFQNKDLDFIRIMDDEFLKCPSNSIDYAVMESTKNGVVVPMDAGWNDVGSWSTLFNAKKKDINNNLIEGDILIENVRNSFIKSTKRLVSVIGLSDIVLIDTDDAIMVLDKKYDQEISTIINQLKQENRSELDNHRKVFRPWGYFDSIDSGHDFQVKRIFINPKSKISLQKHKFRSEHWVVISGTAIITCNNKKFELAKNQSTYIPQGKIHRVENPNDFPLEIIEIQTGSYLGEDDVIRLEDDFGRN